jgi:hypothetical protein
MAFFSDRLPLIFNRANKHLFSIYLNIIASISEPYIVVVKLNVWLHPYFREDPICFKSEPLTGLDPDLGLIVSRL